MKKNKSLILAIGFTVCSLLIIDQNIAIATDIPIEGYVVGEVSISFNGAFSSVLDFGTIFPWGNDIYLPIIQNPETDYITVADDTTTAGFYVALTMTDYGYTGESETQGALAASNFKLTGKYENGAPLPATKGYNDSTKTLSILPDSCGSATVDTFTFHADFLNEAKNYAITGSNSSQTLLTSTVNCLAIARLRFDRATLKIPANSAEGLYSSNVTLTIIDGTP